MILANVSGAVAGLGEVSGEGKANYIEEAGKFMKGVLVTILPIGMVVQSTHDHGPAGGATGSSGKGIEEKRAVFGKGIDCWCLSNGIAVASQGRRFIIGDKENDVLISTKGGKRRQRQKDENLGEGSLHKFEDLEIRLSSQSI